MIWHTDRMVAMLFEWMSMFYVIIDQMDWNNTLPKADSCRVLPPNYVNTNMLVITPI